MEHALIGSLELVILGWGFSLISIGLRGIYLKDRNFPLSCPMFRICLGLSILGNIVAFLGFHFIAAGYGKPGYCDIADNTAYSDALTVLSLLSAGAFAGFCAVEYDKARKDEYNLLNIISLLFISLFYVLFTAICYYIGKSPQTNRMECLSWIVPIAMLLLLLVFVVIDIWDYRDPKNCHGNT
jgi:hypothetical protein